MRPHIVLALASSLLGSVAVAEPGSAPAIARTRGPSTDAHLHDGFYLRIAMGFGGYSESIDEDGSDASTSVRGIASASELALGGAIRPGLILGGGFWTSSVLSSERTLIDGSTPPDEVIAGSGNFTLVGPFVDWYFDARRGLHLQGALGFATVRGWDLQEAQDNPDAVSVGGGIMVGLGYEWWVSEQWSLGVLARLTAIAAVQEDDQDDLWTHGIASTPSVLFSATLN
jgi:hypothetical protein